MNKKESPNEKVLAKIKKQVQLSSQRAKARVHQMTATAKQFDKPRAE